MMREIKFRGKSVEELVGDDQWLEGFGITECKMADGTSDWFIFTNHDGVRAVHPETIGQYAGFHDDSDDQVEVFDGDVVQFEYEGEGHTCEVKYEGSGFMFVADSLPDGYLWASELIEFERSYCWAEGVMVVGNIHDNGLAPKEGADTE